MKSMLTTDEKHTVKNLLNTNQAVKIKENDEVLELVNFDGILDRNTKVVYRQSCRSVRPLNLALNNKNVKNKRTDPVHRALSASRAERNKQLQKVQSNEPIRHEDPFVPLYVYIVGGKEQGHVTVFQRPLSIWRLKLV